MKRSLVVSRRAFLAGGLMAAGTGMLAQPFSIGRVATPDAAGTRGNELYNGIRLPSEWPPKYELNYSPMPVPYLSAPPEVIPIDVGRQLFVDDFLIENTDLQRTYHVATPYDGNPVVTVDKPWEKTPGQAMAMVFSDGVWFDPRDRMFKMWYMGLKSTLYATSHDGIHWVKPSLDFKAGTNVVHEAARDSSTVWLDYREKDPQKRFKFIYYARDRRALLLHVSPDGIHWGEPIAQSPKVGDRTTFFWNPFRNVWVFSIRDNRKDLGRYRRYQEASDLAGFHWKEGEPVPWVSADRLDIPDPVIKLPAQLYNLDAVAYESILLGLFSVWRGPENRDVKHRPKRNEIFLGFSRDGFHWYRPFRQAFIGVSEKAGDWNWGNVQSAGGGCLIVKDRLFFYHSGRRGNPGTGKSPDADSSTGLAFLRRDGFASMDASGAGGTLTTRPVRFRGKYLFVNADLAGGELRVEVLDAAGNRIGARGLDDCVPLRGDRTAHRVAWKTGSDLSAASDNAVRFRFHLTNGSLYSFWVTPDRHGASFGYVAAGGPAFKGPVDQG